MMFARTLCVCMICMHTLACTTTPKPSQEDAVKTPAPDDTHAHSDPAKTAVLNKTPITRDSVDPLVTEPLDLLDDACVAPLIVRLPPLDVTRPQATLTLATLKTGGEGAQYDFAGIECVHVVQGTQQYILKPGESLAVQAHNSELQRLFVRDLPVLIAIQEGDTLGIAGNACFGWELRAEKFRASEDALPAQATLIPPGAWTQGVTLIDVGDTTRAPQGFPGPLEPPAEISPQPCGFSQIDTQAERVMLAVGHAERWSLRVDPGGRAFGDFTITR